MINVPSRIVPAVMTQHVEDAVQIRNVRTELVRAPHVGLSQLFHFDRRLLAHVSGILTAGANAEWFLAQSLESPEAGAGFVLGVHAIETGDSRALAQLLSVAEALPRMERGLLSAFGWVDAPALRGLVAELLKSSSAFNRKIGIAACAMHGVDGLDSQRRLVDADPIVRARALRSAGELGLTGAALHCAAGLETDGVEGDFWAAWAAVMLGIRGAALDRLESFATSSGEFRERAFVLALQAMNTQVANRELQKLAATKEPRRLVIQGCGLAGDPKFVPWLIDQMSDPASSRVAAEAFTLVTGVDLVVAKMDGERPDDFESGPTDSPDDTNVAEDVDDRLPWPHAEKIEAWWRANGRRFQPGVRYFMGAPLTRAHCIDVLKNGYQRQRILAAHYLCLLEPGTPLFNTSAPAWRQQRLLAKMT